MNVEIAAEDALAIVNQVLPVLEQYGALAGPEGAMAATAASLAQVAIPALIRLGEKLAASGEISTDQQQATLDRLNAVLTMFSQPQWRPSTVSPETPTPSAPESPSPS
jgi:hypothetical protein